MASGDDMFVLHAVMADGGVVTHDGSRAAAAETAAAVTAAALLRQRARWASKAYYYSDPATLTLAAATAACNAAVAAAAAASFFSVKYLPLTGLLYAIRLIPDLLITWRNFKKREEHPPLPLFILSELLYPFYFITIALLSLFPSSRHFRSRT
jgi:poly-beta-1,6-N-acetyl-D-glucosamine synthase